MNIDYKNIVIVI